MSGLDFEKPIEALDLKLRDLKDIETKDRIDLSTEIEILEKKIDLLLDEIYKNLTSWQRVHIARHPKRPYSLDYIHALFSNVKEIHGDRAFGDDPSLFTGFGEFQGQPVALVGQQKGRTTEEKMKHHFGMPYPEGYRKAQRLFKLANHFSFPIITFIDTPGAYPGMDAESRGQAQAIAESILTLFTVEVPVIACIIGEGGSGGALAIGVANLVLMLEHSIYSVISPESCASILWSDPSFTEKASDSLKMSAQDLLKLQVIDQIIPEPKGGAHRNYRQVFDNITHSIREGLNNLSKNKDILGTRRQRFEKLGAFHSQSRSQKP